MASKKNGNSKLRRERELRGWSQKRLGFELNANTEMISRWENGWKVPGRYYQAKLCELFGKTAEELGFLEEDLAISSASSVELVSSSSSELVQRPFLYDAYAPVSFTSFSNFNVIMSGDSATQFPFQTSLQASWSFSDIRESIETALDRAIKGFEDMSHNSQTSVSFEKLTRRSILRLLKGAPLALFGIEHVESISDDDLLAKNLIGIPLCWRLYFAGGQADVRKDLPTHIAQLSAVAQSSSTRRRVASELLAQAHQLAYLLELQRQNFFLAEMHVRESFHHAQVAEDTNLQVAALIRKGNLYHTRKWPLQTLKAYQEALRYKNERISPLLMGQLYIGLAEASARVAHMSQNRQQRQDALSFMELAKEQLPALPERDPHFSYTHFNAFTLANFEGLAYTHLGDFHSAWDLFEQVGTNVPDSIVPQRVELWTRQLQTAFAMQDLERCESYLPRVVDSALKIESDLRYSEASEIYEKMYEKWGSDARVRNLADVFVRA